MRSLGRILSGRKVPRGHPFEGGRMCPQVQALQQLNPSMAEHPTRNQSDKAHLPRLCNRYNVITLVLVMTCEIFIHCASYGAFLERWFHGG